MTKYLQGVSLRVLATLREADGHATLRPTDMPATAWYDAIYRLRRRGYEIEQRWTRDPRHLVTYVLCNPQYRNGEEAEARMAAMFHDIDLDILADLVTERLIKRARRAAA